MQFGLFSLPTLASPRASTAALLPETLMLVSHMAQATTRIRLGPFMRLADMPHDVAMRSIEPFGSKVIPDVHAAIGGTT